MICFNACSTEKRISKSRNYIFISRKQENHLINFDDVIGQKYIATRVRGHRWNQGVGYGINDLVSTKA